MESVVAHIGEHNVLAEAYAADRAGMLAWGCLLTGDPAAAEDLVQDALEIALKRARADPGVLDMPVGPWLRGIVARLAMQRRRRLAREFRRALRLQEAVFAPGRLPEQTVDLLRALATLPPRMRACAVLFYGEDRTTSEIATLLGCSPRTVENHLRAARQRLRTRLGDDLGAGEEMHDG